MRLGVFVTLPFFKVCGYPSTQNRLTFSNVRVRLVVQIMTLLEPQIPHSKRLLDSLYINGVAVDLSETGCGKTYVASYIAKKMNVPIVVICPKAVIPAWHKVLNTAGILHLAKQTDKEYRIMNYEKLVRGNTIYMSYDRKQFFNKKNWESTGVKINFPKNCLVILDEVHKCKGTHSLNGNFLVALKNAGYKTLMMSASAATNPMEMKAFGYATYLHDGVNYGKWCSDHAEATKGRFSMVYDSTSSRSREGMRSIHHDLFDKYNIASRLTRMDMRAMFPDNRVMAECYDMGNNTDKIQAVYDQMEAEIARLDERSKNYSGHVFAEMVRARRLAEVLKVPTMVDMIEDMYAEGMSPVVFVNYTETIEALKSRLKDVIDKVGYIIGGQTPRRRQSYIDGFQSDNYRIMLVNQSAGNAGIGLHDLNGNHPRGSLLSPSFSAINLLQSLGRIHRAEGKTPCIQKIVFAANTIEERCCLKVQAKLDNLDLLNDGDLIGDIKIW